VLASTIDQYDVFLAQVRWEAPLAKYSAPEELPRYPLISRLFPYIFRVYFKAPPQTWTGLEGRRYLYLPPKFCHNGRAWIDDCMTYSIGSLRLACKRHKTASKIKLCETVNG